MKVATCGTFDGLHRGHRNFLRTIKTMGELYVVVVPDEIVIENKGEPPLRTETERRQDLLESGLVDDAYIDCLDRGMESIVKLSPDVFVFGHDQDYEERDIAMKEYLRSRGLEPDYRHLEFDETGYTRSNLRDCYSMGISPKGAKIILNKPNSLQNGLVFGRVDGFELTDRPPIEPRLKLESGGYLRSQVFEYCVVLFPDTRYKE